MSRWNIKSSSLIILSCVFFFMLLIVALPDVDLPDTAFHRGTAPVAIHTQVNSAPVSVSPASPVALLLIPHASRPFREEGTFVRLSAPNFLPILLRSLRR